MKIQTLVLALLAPALAVCAKPKAAATSTFQKYHQKQLSSSPVKLDDGSFDALTSLPRNLTAVLLLTALDPKMNCQLCRDLQPDWDLLARSWVGGDKAGHGKVVFGTLDFADGRKSFETLRLQTAPLIYLYLPTVGPDAKGSAEPVKMDFAMGPQSAEYMHAWISRHLPASMPKPSVKRPVNYLRIVIGTTLAVGLFTAATVAWPYVAPILQNRNLWAALSVILVLVFTSGHMFNQIRGTPYISGDGKGGITYFAGGFQNQFGLESQIVAALYAVLAFATTALAVRVPRIKDPRAQQLACFMWCGIMLGTYSFLMSVFRIKNGGYPFWLPPF